MFVPTRPVIYRQASRVLQIWRNNSTISKPIYKSAAFRAATIGLIVSIPTALWFQNSNKDASRSTSSLSEFYDGSLEWKTKSVRPLSLTDAVTWLRQNESSQKGLVGSGVQRWYAVQCGSNFPCEDNLVVAQYPVCGKSAKPWIFWGVFDGHRGKTTSGILREALVSYVRRDLSPLFQSFTNEIPPNGAVNAAIKSSFLRLDNEMITDGLEALKNAKTLTEALSRLSPGYTGACAILSMFDPNSKLLRVACTGDCRAVLGRRDPTSGKYIAIALSKDQTGSNELELARIRAEHPNEPDVIDPKSKRVLGYLEPTRAFGDGMYKWPLEVVQECRDKFFGVVPRPGYLTPPYVTAEPIVTTMEIQEKGDFLIMASDGLWDHLSCEQAVKLVEMWMETRSNDKLCKKAQRSFPEPTKAKGIGKNEWRVKDENFVVEDKNVATHLVRNALGGGDLERLCGVIGAQTPLSRSARDDITVQVIFFGERS